MAYDWMQGRDGIAHELMMNEKRTKSWKKLRKKERMKGKGKKKQLKTSEIR